jgi:hypothetical protein
MKNLGIISISILILFSSCKNLEEYNSNVKVEQKKGSFEYSFVGTGYAKKSENCVTDAERNIFEVILFRGFASTDLQIPLVENETESKSKNASFYESFFEKKGYRNFITSNVDIIEPSKMVKGGFSCKIRLTVNMNSLKSHLEQNKIIRKFGF